MPCSCGSKVNSNPKSANTWGASAQSPTTTSCACGAQNHPNPNAISGCCDQGKKANRSKKVPIIWIIGGPGSGKGTLCTGAVEKYGFTHLSVGDLLRQEVSSGSARGSDLQKIMEQGKLVSNDIVIALLKDVIKGNQATAKGFLIDGYPREKQQGALFEKEIAPVDLILYLDASEATLVKRIRGRGASSGRADDNEETIKLRIQTFKANNEDILSQYTDKLKRLNAENSIPEVFKDATTYIDPLVA